MVNWFFALYGATTTPGDFATYLLAILIVNGLLYVAFYMIMKVCILILFKNPLNFFGYSLPNTPPH